MYTLSFVSQKGGVGKTTSAINVASCLASHWSQTVLIVDLDPQSAATVSLGFEPNEDQNMFHVLTEDLDIADMIVETQIPNVHLAHSDIGLAGAEVLLAGRVGWDRILELKLASVAGQYDYCLIDAPPSLGILSQSALITADTVLIPMQCQFLSLRALKQLMRILQTTILPVYPNIDLRIFRNMYIERNRQAEAISQAIEDIAGKHLMDTTLHNATDLQNAASQRQSIFEFAASTRAASEYRSLTKEILDYVSQKENA